MSCGQNCWHLPFPVEIYALRAKKDQNKDVQLRSQQRNLLTRILFLLCIAQKNLQTLIHQFQHIAHFYQVGSSRNIPGSMVIVV